MLITAQQHTKINANLFILFYRLVSDGKYPYFHAKTPSKESYQLLTEVLFSLTNYNNLSFKYISLLHETTPETNSSIGDIITCHKRCLPILLVEQPLLHSKATDGTKHYGSTTNERL